MGNCDMGMGESACGLATDCIKAKWRWLFEIDGVSVIGLDALPPSKGARPSLNFKEIEAQHLTETYYYGGKPDWKPINLVLYDLKRGEHPVMKWIKSLYEISQKDVLWHLNPEFKKEATLKMLDGCGQVIEKWVYENAWPQSIEFGDLDMGTSEVVFVDLTLRYDRAYIV